MCRGVGLSVDNDTIHRNLPDGRVPVAYSHNLNNSEASAVEYRKDNCRSGIGKLGSEAGSIV